MEEGESIMKGVQQFVIPEASYQRLSYTKDSKMVLDTSLLNTQHYKVRIKSKMEQSQVRSSALPYTLV